MRASIAPERGRVPVRSHGIGTGGEHGTVVGQINGTSVAACDNVVVKLHLFGPVGLAGIAAIRCHVKAAFSRRWLGVPRTFAKRLRHAKLVLDAVACRTRPRRAVSQSCFWP